ncbi:uncharacterized protein [Palaemon carinicauda]|uniref:uncharacterized protein n=1 Tax=Palaemon carinicauda TaxID=392227 RepID=UPI0035B5B709
MYSTRSSRRCVLYLVLFSILCFCELNKHFMTPGTENDELTELIMEDSPSSSTSNYGRKEYKDGRLLEKRLQKETEFFELLNQPSGFTCKKLLTLGGESCRKFVDGDKHLCVDSYIQPPMNRCLVYSFGISTDVSFEVSLSRLFSCEIYMFDPTPMSAWLLVLEYMMDHNLLNNVLQLAIEIHADYVKRKPTSLWLAEFQKMYDVLAGLEGIGFRRISYRENMNMVGFITLPSEDKGRPACGEIFYVRDPQTMTSSSS